MTHETSVPYVRVERRPYGSTIFMFATVDLFTAETLTVSRTDTDAEIKVFQPGTWATATAYDAQGNPTHSFISRTEQAHKDALVAAALARTE